jgi:hypothetical protein
MHADERVMETRRIADHHDAVDGHVGRQRGERTLPVLRPEIVGQFFDLTELGVAHTGVPLHLEVALAQLERQWNRPEHADRMTAGTGDAGRQAHTVAIDLEQLALLRQPLSDGRINISKHGADYADLARFCDVRLLLTIQSLSIINDQRVSNE